MSDLPSAAMPGTFSPADLKPLAEVKTSTKEDVAAAVKATDRWLKSCGPEKVDGCRAKALAALKSVGKSNTPTTPITEAAAADTAGLKEAA